MYTDVSAKILPGDIVVAAGSVRYEHTSPEYAPIEYTAVADFDVALALRTTSEMQSSALLVVANALNVRCGSCFHVI